MKATTMPGSKRVPQTRDAKMPSKILAQSLKRIFGSRVNGASEFDGRRT